MKWLLVVLAALGASLSFTTSAGQGSRVPVLPTSTGAEGMQCDSFGVPPGYMILGETTTAPRGYSYSGLTLTAEASAGSWRTGTPMPFARTESGGAVLGGKAYMIGGLAGVYTDSVEEFDPESDAWTARAPMPTARSRVAVVAVGENIYALGGYNGTQLATVEVFVPATDSWSVCAPMPTPRTFLAAAAVGGKIYAVGGTQDGITPLKTVEEFDPIMNTWTARQPMPTARGKLALVVLNDKIFALGGYNDPLPVEVYDPLTDQWTSRSPGPPVYDWAAVNLNGRTFTFGGYYGYSLGTFAGCYEYFADTDSWVERPSMPTARQSLVALNIAGALHAIGGNVYGGPSLATVEILEPPRQVFLHRKN